MSEYKFPTETVELPSKGLIYPSDSPLRSGKVEMKYMTAKEEDILTNQAFIQQGVVLDKLLKALTLDKFNIKTLFPGDRRVHWDFLKGISNDEEALNNPSVQIHELNITTGPNGSGDEIATKVPYVSFFMPRSIFMESTISVNKRK